VYVKTFHDELIFKRLKFIPVDWIDLGYNLKMFGRLCVYERVLDCDYKVFSGIIDVLSFKVATFLPNLIKICF